MRTKCSSIHWQTPALKVRDSRQLTVREVRYLRSAESVEAQPLVTRQQYNPAGHQVEQRDPRLFDASTPANVATVYSLSAHPLMIDSVDAGWRLNLPGMAGQALERWDGRGNHWQSCFDEQLRVLSEATADSGHLETRNYADASADSGHNLCGQMTTLKDTSGSLTFQSFALLGQPLEQTRTFADSQSHTSRQSFGSLNQLLTQTDAGGHRQTFSYDVAGQVARISLQRQGSEPQSILQRAQYNAHGQIIERLAANHVVSQWLYDPANDWLLSAQAGVAGQPLLQNFTYAYDAVGNVLRIDDSTFTPVYFANQYIDGHRAFSYDSLDRLLTASGHDAAPASEIPGRPSPSDPNNLRTYTQHFEYDVAGNLIKQVHERATGGYTRQMQVAPSSNRALPWQADDPPPDFATAFDDHGNLLNLRHGPQLAWNALDQLRQITLLKRNNALADDQETYFYSLGERVSKRLETHSVGASHFQQVRYLPGLEIRTRESGEELHVIILPDNVRCLHWRSAPPADVANNQLRYSLGDHLGSSATELDEQARVLSQETYFPFGGTAIWLPHSKSAGDYKTIRYSGKEMDVSGLYYYGARYYAPWLQRWVSADPAGDVDGLNLYVMVGNNPLTNIDPDGRALTKAPGWLAIAAGFKSETNRFVDEFDDAGDAMTPEQREQTTFKEFLGKKSGIGALTRGGVLGGAAGTSIALAVTNAVPVLDASYTAPILGFLGSSAGGYAYAYVRYRFFKSNVLRAVAQYKHKVDAAKKLAEDMLRGVVPTDMQNQMANMRIQAAYDMLAEVKTWPVAERALFTSGRVEGETILDITKRFENIKKTMIGGTTELLEPDNESLAGVSTISGSLNDFASAAGDNVQGESIQGENAQADYSWWAQFQGFFKIGTRRNSIPMDSLA
jgi:insecticidal toxin complex protein TccC